MTRRGRQSNVEVERLQITLARDNLEHLDRVIKLRGFGRNRNEAVSAIVVDWIKTRLAVELDAHLKLEHSGKEFDEKIRAKEGAT